MNTAYKHLDTKVRIAELTIGQWAGAALGLGVAIIWGFYVCPFPTAWTIGTAVYLGAIPGGFVVMSTFYEIDLTIILSSALKWVRVRGRFVPGAGANVKGYVVTEDPRVLREAAMTPTTLDPAALWQS